MQCDIIIPVWNELKRTRECLESIIKNTGYPYRLIIVDNASDAETAEYLREFASHTKSMLIRNDNNEGFVKAINNGLGVSIAPYACIVNNDTVAAEGWLSEMVNVAGLDNHIGLVNPSSNNLGQHLGRDTIESYAAKLKPFKGQYIEMGACLGFCMLIKRELIDKIGNFDEIYQRGNFEETDYSRRAEREGYYCVRAKGAYVYHHMKTSFRKIGDYEDSFRKNQEIFNMRWGTPKRMLYIVTKGHGKLFEWIRDDVAKRARGGNWVWLFCKKGGKLPDIKEHSNIKLVHVPEMLFEWNCMVRILKKKKKFDSIYADDKWLVDKINRYRRFHGADAMLMGG